mmetsp:Transcript_24123/g.43490  ORF Transcript_24123/g.43490 Transcript_24123/m.43490 type:complete len:256 (-) Transcript_24123:1342-2109(-)
MLTGRGVLCLHVTPLDPNLLHPIQGDLGLLGLPVQVQVFRSPVHGEHESAFVHDLVSVVKLLLADGDDILRLSVLGVGQKTGQEVPGDMVVQFPLLAVQVVAVRHLGWDDWRVVSGILRVGRRDNLVPENPLDRFAPVEVVGMRLEQAQEVEVGRVARAHCVGAGDIARVVQLLCSLYHSGRGHVQTAAAHLQEPHQVQPQGLCHLMPLHVDRLHQARAVLLALLQRHVGHPVVVHLLPGPLEIQLTLLRLDGDH